MSGEWYRLMWTSSLDFVSIWPGIIYYTQSEHHNHFNASRWFAHLALSNNQSINQPKHVAVICWWIMCTLYMVFSIIECNRNTCFNISYFLYNIHQSFDIRWFKKLLCTIDRKTMSHGFVNTLSVIFLKP